MAAELRRSSTPGRSGGRGGLRRLRPPLSAVGAPSPGASRTGRNPGNVRRDPGTADTLVQRFYDSLATVEARIPPAALDLRALAVRLDNDPRRMIEFVSDSLRYDHYDGVLRGAAAPSSRGRGTPATSPSCCATFSFTQERPRP
jgi:hypothetical protein